MSDLRALEPLKNCPFCGGEAIIVHKDSPFRVVGCIRCGAKMEKACIQSDAVADWNRRARSALAGDGETFGDKLLAAMWKIHQREWPAGDIQRAARHASEMWDIADEILEQEPPRSLAGDGETVREAVIEECVSAVRGVKWYRPRKSEVIAAIRSLSALPSPIPECCGNFDPNLGETCCGKPECPMPVRGEELATRLSMTSLENRIDQLRGELAEKSTLISQLRSRVEEMEGWKLVPIEPTEEMQQAGAYQVSGCTRVGAECVYHAMISASPSPPIPENDSSERKSVVK